MSKARDLANVISGTGTISVDAVPALPTSKITSGTFANARLSSGSVTQHVDLTALSADNLTSGTVPSARLSLAASDIPNLDTAKVTTGTFANARLSSGSVTQHVDLTSLNADNLTSGTVPNARITLDADEIPDLPASKITSGSLGTARIPTLDGSKISGGTFGSVNGSNLSSLPASAPSSSDVGSATAGLSLGAVGTYGNLTFPSNSNLPKNQGDTISGGSIKWSNCHGHTNNVSPSGTWRILGRAFWNGQSEHRTSIFLRIS